MDSYVAEKVRRYSVGNPTTPNVTGVVSPFAPEVWVPHNVHKISAR